MSKYTPGPWRFEIEGTLSAHHPTIYAENEEVAQVSAYVWTEPDGKHRDYSEKELALANARLIARAPEMAELLKELDEFSETDFSDGLQMAERLKDIFSKVHQLLTGIE